MIVSDLPGMPGQGGGGGSGGAGGVREEEAGDQLPEKGRGMRKSESSLISTRERFLIVLTKENP